MSSNVNMTSAGPSGESSKVGTTSNVDMISASPSGDNLGVGTASNVPRPSSSKKPKRFEIKQWNVVALWSWGMGVEP